MTSYVLLKKIDGQWTEQKDRVEGASGKAAIRASIHGDPAGEYVAVPARSWQPVKVAVETALKFS